MTLTDTEVKKVKAKANAYRLSDGAGLYLWVTVSGSKLWRWGYRYEGKEKLMALGKYPDVSLAQAREAHAAARKLLASGIDPMAQRKADKTSKRIEAANSFTNIAMLWHSHWQTDKNPRYAEYVQRRLEVDVFPVIGAKPIHAIQAPDIVAMVKGIEKRGATDIAKRALETVGQIFRYGIAHGYTTRNPAKDFKPSDVLKPTGSRNYARIDAKELPALLRAIEAYDGAAVTRLAIKLMALTFVRTSELIGARWAEFDLEAGRWDIPAVRMKMKTPHLVPLSSQAIEVLQTLVLISGKGELFFPSERGHGKSMSNNTILGALKRMGYAGKMTGHGFRGLASTVLHEQGYTHEHIELQLAHAPRNAVSAAYNHALYLEPRAKMMQDWADYLDLTRRGAKVLPLRKTA